MPEDIDRQSIIDEEHLKLLSWGFMIFAGVAAFISLFGLFYVLMGIFVSALLSHVPVAAGRAGGPPPGFVGWIFVVFGLAVLLLAMGMAIARFWAARCVQQRKSRTFCLVIAALGCLEFPYGTALGVLSFLVLGRPSVVKQFAAKQ